MKSVLSSVRSADSKNCAPVTLALPVFVLDWILGDISARRGEINLVYVEEHGRTGIRHELLFDSGWRRKGDLVGRGAEVFHTCDGLLLQFSVLHLFAFGSEYSDCEEA